jgi:hypothetical protein
MLLKLVKGDYLLIKNNSFLSKLFSIFQKKSIRNKENSSINLDNNFKYRRKSGVMFDNFTDKLKNNISIDYYQIILSSSGLIKSSYFDKLLWSINNVKNLTNNNILIDKSEAILARAAYFYFKKQGVVIFGSSPFYSTSSYIAKSIVWIVVEFFRTIRQSIKKVNHVDNPAIKTDILIVASQPYHYMKLEKLIKTLIRDKKMSIVVATPFDIPKGDQFESQLINYLNINSFRSINTLMQTCVSIINYWSSLNYVKKSIKKFNNKIDDLEVLEALLRESFIKWHYDQINTHVRTEALANQIVFEVNPTLLYSIDSSDYVVRIFEKLAHEKDIPTYCLPFYYISDYEQNLTRRSESRYGGINSQSSEIIKEETGTKYNVDIIGDPFYDNFYFNKDHLNELKNKIGINNGDKIVGFFSFPTTSNKLGITNAQYDKTEYGAILHTLIDACISQGHHILIKPHPVDNNNINQIVNKFPKKDRIHIVNNMNSLEMISISDLVVGAHSKVSFETILLNTKYLLLQWNENPDQMKLIEYNVCQVSFNSQDINEKLKRSLFNPFDDIYLLNRKRYLQEMYVYPYDKSSERLLNVFDQIIKKP